jgi:hypothetical protein
MGNYHSEESKRKIALKRQIEQEQDKERKSNLQAQLEVLKDKSCPLIDLRKNRIYVQPFKTWIWP